MGWFDEQIKQRAKSDNEVFQNAFAAMADAIIGTGKTKSLLDRNQKSEDAIREILKYYHVKSTSLSNNLTDFNQQLDYMLRPSGMMTREVILENNWYKNATGAFLAFCTNGDPVALIPNKANVYSFYDYQSDKTVILNKETSKLLASKAICFYKPLPLKKLNITDLLFFIIQTLSPMDYIIIGVTTFIVTLIGMLSPKLTQILFSNVIEEKNINLLLGIGFMMISASITVMLINIAKNIFMDRINTKTSLIVESASIMRTLSMPTSFFKQYNTGEVAQRTSSINSLCSMLSNAIFSTGLTSIFSLLYIVQITAFAPALLFPSLAITLSTILFSLFSSLVQMKISKKKMLISSKVSGVIYALICGVQKIKLSGSEKRAFSKWANLYSQSAQLSYNPPMFIKVNSVISTAISSIGTIVLYYFAVTSNVSVADYFAFNTSYGMVSGAFMSLSGIALTLATIKPTLDMVKPLLETEPEVSDGKKIVTNISGSIELNNISFRYKENTPLILDGLSLNIRPGQYVAIVGNTGCGKSTLVRLLLGFETPQKGAIYYDGKDLTDLDLPSLRRRIGVVLQSSKLFSGDIYTNIAISAPSITLDEAWDAAKIAGIADDIHDMPMEMHTLISEGNGNISGGQRQRLMIARAIAHKPKVLILDEATSALDNITQKKIIKSLSELKCTRIVIAHRLSTIKSCDRIIMLEGGKIIEDGTYDELICRNGKFAELVARQQISTNLAR